MNIDFDGNELALTEELGVNIVSEEFDLEPTVELCLSCEAWTQGAVFCTDCIERSKQELLIPEFDDLGIAG